MTAKPLSVTEVSAYIKALLDHDEVLGQLCVRGELSNYKMHSSGHHYFTLKDDGAVINAVMFRSDASRLPFQPGNGMKVIVYGRVSSFPKSGQYQIYVSQMQPDGVGALYVAFEQLKEKLLREGLFDKDVKKTLPRYPRRIALVTSPTGAAVRDMIRVLGRRFPACEVLVCPVKVQGEGAAQEIAAEAFGHLSRRFINMPLLWERRRITGRGSRDRGSSSPGICSTRFLQYWSVAKMPPASRANRIPLCFIVIFIPFVRAGRPAQRCAQQRFPARPSPYVGYRQRLKIKSPICSMAS